MWLLNPGYRPLINCTNTGRSWHSFATTVHFHECCSLPNRPQPDPLILLYLLTKLKRLDVLYKLISTKLLFFILVKCEGFSSLIMHCWLKNV